MKSTVVRLGGISAVLGGLYLLILFIIESVTGNDLEEVGIIWLLLPLMPIFLTLGAAGLLRLADGHKGVQVSVVIIGIGALLMAAGFAMMAWLGNENGWPVMFLGMMLHPFGFLLFGLANWRTRALARWNGLPLIIGIVTCLLLLLTVLAEEMLGLTEQQSEQAFAVYLLTLAVGWILLGIDMLIGYRETGTPITNIATLILFVFLLAACGGSSEPKVSFQSPKDGETVSNPVQVVMEAENFTVEAAGDVHEMAGHLHVMIDVPCLKPGEVIPKDDNHRHFGDGSTEADLELAQGRHTLCLQAADGAHIALEGEGMAHEITVSVP